jgi:tripartite ATP-independent transporter DctP family solute receptor
MKKTVMLFLAMCLVCLTVTVSFAVTTSGALKFAHTEPAIDILSSPYLALTNTFKDVVESQTNGRFTIQVFPSKQLGDLADILIQCQRGVIELTAGQNVSNLAAIYPEAGVLEMPYAFANTYIARTLLDGYYGQLLSDRMAEKTGVRPLVWLPSALRCFANNAREIHSPEDMKGLKIRVMPAPMQIEMVKSLGAQATPIAWAELYTALQTGVVDGHEQPPYQIPMAKLDEVSKYFTIDNHVLNVMGLSINEKFFQSLTPEDQKIFKLAARQAQLAFLGIIQAKEPLDYETMRKSGMVITAPSAEQIAEFKALAQPAAIKLFVESIGQEKVDEFLEAVKKAEEEAGKR